MEANENNVGKIKVMQYLIFRKKRNTSNFVWIDSVGAMSFSGKTAASKAQRR